MSASLDRMIDTSYRILELSKKIIRSCHLKKNKKHSYSRFIISFFFQRSRETFESFLILIKKSSLVDASLLLRSFAEMGINLGYIFTEEKDKEINSLKYMLEGDSDQLKLINSNLDDLKEIDNNIEKRRDELKEGIQKTQQILKSKYNLDNWNLPPIEQRAKKTGIEILDKFYNQVYRYYSNVEHHGYFFGRNYIDEDKCEPLEKNRGIERSPLFNPRVMLFLFRTIFLTILKTFNEEYQLNEQEEIDKFTKIHEAEYSFLKES